MPVYKYSAVDKDGKMYKGYMEAASLEELEIKLKDNHLLLVEFTETKEKKDEKFSLTLSKKAKPDELIQIFYAIGNMLESGVGLTGALEYVKKSLDRDYAKKVMDNMIMVLRQGGSFTAAIKANKDFFPDYVIEPIDIGETTGKLPQTLIMIADQIEKNKKIKEKIKKASIYPGFIIFSLIVLITVVLNFVFPRIVKSIKEVLAGHQYPPITKVIMFIAGKIEIIAPFVPLFFGILILVFLIKNKIPFLKNFFDSIQLKIPYYKDIVLYKELINFLQVLLIGIQAGISLLKSFSIAEHSVNNSILRDKITRIKTSFSLGESLGESFKNASLHPYLEAMVITGESTGTLDKAIENALYYFNSRAEERVDKFFAWLEPIIIVFLGGVVLTVLLCSLLPMWESMSYIGKF